jgi:hypothetical protein
MENTDSIFLYDSIYSPLPQGGVGGESSSLPQYYRENYFSNDTLFHPECPNYQHGVAGDPIPYSVRSDSFMTLLLLLGFVVLVISTAQSQNFLVRQMKNFFYQPHDIENINETSVELRFQLFLIALLSLLLSITAFQYANDSFDTTFFIDNELYLIGIFYAVFLAYFFLKAILYMFVNNIFFDRSCNRHWMKSLLFIRSMESILLFPAVLLNIYFNIPLQNILFYFVFILIIAKILTFYKCLSIFFRQNGIFLRSFLYFCSLEIVPLLGLAGGLLTLINSLKLNF